MTTVCAPCCPADSSDSTNLQLPADQAVPPKYTRDQLGDFGQRQITNFRKPPGDRVSPSQKRAEGDLLKNRKSIDTNLTRHGAQKNSEPIVNCKDMPAPTKSETDARMPTKKEIDDFVKGNGKTLPGYDSPGY